MASSPAAPPTAAAASTCLAASATSAPHPLPSIPHLIPRRWEPLQQPEAGTEDTPSSFTVLQVRMPIVDSTNNKRRLQRMLKSQTHNPHSHHRSIIGQWNVMADAFSSPSHYTRVPASGEATDWPLRRERIIGGDPAVGPGRRDAPGAAWCRGSRRWPGCPSQKWMVTEEDFFLNWESV